MNPEYSSRDTNKLSKLSLKYSPSTFFLLLAIFFLALLFHSDLAPLEETHWDVPIYVQLSKRAAEANTLANYHAHARDIRLGAGDDVHWYFTRIGHILLLGEITKFLGATETALVAMQWLYRVFMALSVTLCVVLGIRLVKQFRIEQPDPFWKIGYFIAAVTYVVSDSYRGLQGHLISEPPAFLTLLFFTLVLLSAVERRSMVLGIFAGCLLFVLFFIRIDAVLPGVFFLLLLLIEMARLKRFDAVPSIISAGLTASVFYLIYAWWFFPLVNPQSLADFSSSAKEMFPGVPAKGLFAIAIAGGLLWVGAFMAISMLWRDSVVRFAITWLGLALLPLIIDSFSGRTVQTRMAFFIVPPLMILSAEGWIWMVRNFVEEHKIRTLAITTCFMMILAFTPYSLVMQESRNWAINYLPPEIQKYLFPSLAKRGTIGPAMEDQDSRLGILIRPISERWTLEYLKVREIADFLNSSGHFAYLLWPKASFAGQHSLQSYIRLFHYFGKEYPENIDFVLTKFPGKLDTEACAARVPTKMERVIYCTALDERDLVVLQNNNISLYILGVDEYPIPPMPEIKLTVLLSIPPFTLYGVTE